MAGTAPPPEPLELDEAKLNLRLDPDGFSEDTLIASLIVAARVHVENTTGLVLTPRTVTETAAQLGRWIDLTSWPVTSVSAIRYPVAGVMTPLVGGAWLASYLRRPVRLLPALPGWGMSSGIWGRCTPGLPVEIDVVAGYATPADVPVPVTQAMQLLVSHFYSNRSASEVGARAAAVEIPFGVAELLRPYRVARV